MNKQEESKEGMGHPIESVTADHLKKNQADNKFLCRKLTLWHSGTFRPIHTHKELEPIMASIGFFPYVPKSTSTDSLIKELVSQTGAQPAVRENAGANGALGENSQKDKTTTAGEEPVKWREYVFRRTNLIPGSDLKPESKIRPRLPYPRVDGLHLRFYLVFFAALECYINPYAVIHLFHIRPMPMNESNNEYNKVFKRMTDFTDPEIEVANFFLYREDNLDDHTFSEMFNQLEASIDDLSQNETAKKYVRKDEKRKIEEDERDDSSDFVCLIDNMDALYGTKKGGRLSRGKRSLCASGNFRGDNQGNGVVDYEFSFGSLIGLIQTDIRNFCGARVPRRKRSVVKRWKLEELG